MNAIILFIRYTLYLILKKYMSLKNYLFNYLLNESWFFFKSRIHGPI